MFKSALAVGICAAMSMGEVRAQGQAIEFSSPRDAAVTANLLEQLGQDPVSKPLDDPFRAPAPVMPQSSLQGAVMRQEPRANQQPALTQRQRDELERKRNWVFMKPEDMISGITEEDIFNLKKLDALSDPDKNLTPMELYYQRQFEKKKPKEDDQQYKKGEGKSNRDDEKNLRDKSAAEALMNKITGQAPGGAGDIVTFVPKKDNGDTSAGYNDPFSSANYGPDAPASAQQARTEVYRKLYGLTSDADPVQTPVANGNQPSANKPKAQATPSSFYAEKSPTPVLGFLAPTAPIAPGKPTMDTVVAKPDLLINKPNPLFISPSTRLPQHPF